MRTIMRSAVLALAALPFIFAQTTSPKRGLALVETAKAEDERYWTSGDLTWYYNWKAEPDSSIDHSKLQFVPMLWGVTSSNGGQPFYTRVRNLRSQGYNITHVLGFNEPDGCGNAVYGGSCAAADTAAEVWIREIEPLKELGIKLGAPAVTGTDTGFEWMQAWFTACNGQCNPDFIPIHSYGNFEALASHVGRVNATYQNMTMWATEYAFATSSDYTVTLDNAQEFMNQSLAFFDRIDYMERYAYFGAFRSDVSNVGPYSAMLDQDGDLTDVGAWYLGKAATGNVPEGASTRAAARFAGSAFVVLAAAFYCLG